MTEFCSDDHARQYRRGVINRLQSSADERPEPAPPLPSFEAPPLADVSESEAALELANPPEPDFPFEAEEPRPAAPEKTRIAVVGVVSAEEAEDLWRLADGIAAQEARSEPETSGRPQADEKPEADEQAEKPAAPKTRRGRKRKAAATPKTAPRRKSASRAKAAAEPKPEPAGPPAAAAAGVDSAPSKPKPRRKRGGRRWKTKAARG